MLSCFSRKKNINVNGKFKKPYYMIKSVASGRVLEVNADPSKQNELVIWDVRNGDGQKFNVRQKGPDYLFKCKRNKLYLTVDGPHNGAKIYGTSKNLGENQRFRLEEVVPGSKKYAIYTFFGKVLDVRNKKSENGSEITQYDFIGEDHQIWVLEDEPGETVS